LSRFRSEDSLNSYLLFGVTGWIIKFESYRFLQISLEFQCFWSAFTYTDHSNCDKLSKYCICNPKSSRTQIFLRSKKGAASSLGMLQK